MDIKELSRPSGLSVGAILAIITLTSSIVFTGTTIYWNFGLVQKEMDIIEIEIQDLREQVEYNDNKSIRKRKEATERLDELEQKGSDEE